MAPDCTVFVCGPILNSRRGLEADQKVIAAHGCYAMTATTALTAQNTQGVFDIHHIPPAFVSRQIDACFDDIGVDVIKLGISAVYHSYEVKCLSRRYAGFGEYCESRNRSTSTSSQRLSNGFRSCMQLRSLFHC